MSAPLHPSLTAAPRPPSGPPAVSAPSTVHSSNQVQPPPLRPSNQDPPPPAGPSSASSATAGPSNGPLKKKRSWVSSYYEYNLAEMTDSRGGFLTPAAPASQPGDRIDDPEAAHGAKRARTHYPALDPETHDKCEACQTSTDLDPRYQDHFHVNVCWTCKQAHPEKYALLTKTEARADYLLTDDELKDDILFPHVWRKKNPRKQTFHDMYLYLRSHVEAYAVTKWGSLEKMDEEFERRERDKERRKEEKFKKNVERLRKATRTSLWSGKGNGIAEAAGAADGVDAAHVHEFQEGEEEGKLVCSCGMVVEGEFM